MPEIQQKPEKFLCWKSFSIGAFAAIAIVPAGIALGALVLLWILQGLT